MAAALRIVLAPQSSSPVAAPAVDRASGGDRSPCAFPARARSGRGARPRRRSGRRRSARRRGCTTRRPPRATTSPAAVRRLIPGWDGALRVALLEQAEAAVVQLLPALAAATDPALPSTVLVGGLDHHDRVALGDGALDRPPLRGLRDDNGRRPGVAAEARERPCERHAAARSAPRGVRGDGRNRPTAHRSPFIYLTERYWD